MSREATAEIMRLQEEEEEEEERVKQEQRRSQQTTPHKGYKKERSQILSHLLLFAVNLTNDVIADHPPGQRHGGGAHQPGGGGRGDPQAVQHLRLPDGSHGQGHHPGALVLPLPRHLRLLLPGVQEAGEEEEGVGASHGGLAQRGDSTGLTRDRFVQAEYLNIFFKEFGIPDLGSYEENFDTNSEEQVRQSH